MGLSVPASGARMVLQGKAGNLYPLGNLFRAGLDLCVGAVELLGCGQVESHQETDGLHIALPDEVAAELPVCFKIEMM